MEPVCSVPRSLSLVNYGLETTPILLTHNHEPNRIRQQTYWHTHTPSWTSVPNVACSFVGGIGCTMQQRTVSVQKGGLINRLLQPVVMHLAPSDARRHRARGNHASWCGWAHTTDRYTHMLIMMSAHPHVGGQAATLWGHSWRTLIINEHAVVPSEYRYRHSIRTVTPPPCGIDLVQRPDGDLLTVLPAKWVEFHRQSCWFTSRNHHDTCSTIRWPNGAVNDSSGSQMIHSNASVRYERWGGVGGEWMLQTALETHACECGLASKWLSHTTNHTLTIRITVKSQSNNSYTHKHRWPAITYGNPWVCAHLPCFASNRRSSNSRFECCSSSSCQRNLTTEKQKKTNYHVD